MQNSSMVFRLTFTKLYPCMLSQTHLGRKILVELYAWPRQVVSFAMGFYENTKATPNQPFHKSHGKFAASFRMTQSQCKWSTRIRDLLKQKREIMHSLRIISCLGISTQYKEDTCGQLNCKFYKEWIGQLVLYLKDNWLVFYWKYLSHFSLPQPLFLLKRFIKLSRY